MKVKNTDIEQCKKDIIYLTSGIENWKNKRFLYTAIISHLTNSTFNYDENTAINAYEEMTNTQIKIVNGNGGIL